MHGKPGHLEPGLRWPASCAKGHECAAKAGTPHVPGEKSRAPLRQVALFNSTYGLFAGHHAKRRSGRAGERDLESTAACAEGKKLVCFYSWVLGLFLGHLLELHLPSGDPQMLINMFFGTSLQASSGAECSAWFTLTVLFCFEVRGQLMGRLDARAERYRNASRSQMATGRANVTLFQKKASQTKKTRG